MALNKLTADVSIISKLGDEPGVENGLDEEKVKAKFDEAAEIIKDYLNNYLIPELDKNVDVNALLADILDTTMTKADKAANAAAVGSIISNLRNIFEKTVHSGGCVLDTGDKFAQSLSGVTTVRVEGGEGVFQGNLFTIGTFTDVQLAEGTYGLSRNDLIVIRCTKGADDVLSYSIEAITGTNTSGEPVDPTYLTGNINDVANMSDFPIYRVTFNNGSMENPVALFTPKKALDGELQKLAQEFNEALDSLKGYVDQLTAVLPATVTAGSILVGDGDNKMVEKTPAEAIEHLGALRTTQVWENASPTSTFAKQEIPITLTDVNLVAVVAKHGKSTTATNMFFGKPGERMMLMIAANNGNVATRPVDIGSAEDGKLSFEVGRSGAGEQDNNYIIPLRIYTIKGGF